MAEHCARLWVEREPVDLTLVGRHAHALQALMQDLTVRGGSRVIVRTLVCDDFCNCVDIQKAVETIYLNGPVDIALIAHGFLPSQTECEKDLALCAQTFSINAVSPALFAQLFADYMLRANRGKLALISSVAGDRGRRSNYVYGSAKSLLSFFAQGLQHRAVGSRVKVVLIKPGPTDTPMTQNRVKRSSLAPVEKVAEDIVRGIDRGCRVVYTPMKWRFIMTVIKWLPNFIFDRLNF